MSKPSRAAMRAAKECIPPRYHYNNVMVSSYAASIDRHMVPRAEADALAEAADRCSPPPKGDHGGPLVTVTAYYEDGSCRSIPHEDWAVLRDALAAYRSKREKRLEEALVYLTMPYRSAMEWRGWAQGFAEIIARHRSEREKRLEEALRKIAAGHTHNDGHCVRDSALAIASCQAAEIALAALRADADEEPPDA